MEKGLEDNVDDIEDNAYDDAGDGKTHLKVRRKKQVMAKQMTGEKKKLVRKNLWQVRRT